MSTHATASMLMPYFECVIACRLREILQAVGLATIYDPFRRESRDVLLESVTDGSNMQCIMCLYKVRSMLASSSSCCSRALMLGAPNDLRVTQYRYFIKTGSHDNLV